MRRPSWKIIKAGIISRISYDAGMGFQYEASAGIGQSRGESVYTYVAPLFFLSHTDRPSLGWLDFIIDKKQYMFGKKIQILNFYLLLCGWCSAGGILSVVLIAEETAAPSRHITMKGEKNSVVCQAVC